MSVKSQLERIYVNQMVKYLTKEAMKVIKRAKMTKDAKNRTYTQYDSFGALICYNGKVIHSILTSDTADATNVSYHGGGYNKLDNLGYGDKDVTAGHRGWENGGIPDGTGVEWAEMFKREYKPKTKGFELVVFNAAYYSKFLEEGVGVKKKYRIISQVFGDMDEIASQLNGAKVVPYNLGR